MDVLGSKTAIPAADIKHTTSFLDTRPQEFTTLFLQEHESSAASMLVVVRINLFKCVINSYWY